MKKVLIVALLFALLGFASTAFAQAPVTPTNKLGWDQPAPTLAEAQAYTYRYYPDSATTGTALVAVTCVGTASPYQCDVNFPAFTPGSHTLTLTAGNAAGESAKSAPFAFVFVVTPGIPLNLRIK